MSNSAIRVTLDRWLLGVILTVGLVVGCESDPLLSPQDSGSQTVGSYGLVHFGPEVEDSKKQQDGESVSEGRNTERF